MPLLLSGCAYIPATGYISKAEHPYERKIYADIEKVTGSMVYVLKKKGWRISEEDVPSVFERDERYDNSGYQNMLIITKIKKRNYLLYSTMTHLNVFIHATGNTCDVEIRYEARTPLIRHVSTRDDRLAEGLLDDLEREAAK